LRGLIYVQRARQHALSASRSRRQQHGTSCAGRGMIHFHQGRIAVLASSGWGSGAASEAFL